MWRKIRSSLLVILVPILVGPAVAYATNTGDWPWYTLPLIWVVGLAWIWRPRKEA